jgi:signal transduction histidine kinase
VFALDQLSVVMAITIAIGMTAGLLAWRERHEPGARPLVLMLFGQSWWSATFVLQLGAATLDAKVFWSNVQWIGVVVIPVGWLLFALEYTGRDRYARPRYVALLVIVPTITVALALTGQHHDLLYLRSELIRREGFVMLRRTGGPWFWLITGYTYLLGVVGSLPLLALVVSNSLQFRGQSAALLVGTLAPWVSNALFLLGAIPVAGLDPTPIAFSVSGAAYLGALTRFRLLGTSPAPNTRARRLVFERMRDGAVVVDGHGYVVDINESASDLLEIDSREALGRPGSEVIPRYDDLTDADGAGRLTVYDSANESRYDVTVTRVRDFHGRDLGRVISFHDVDELVRRQQRLEVLNRVLRHNIRNETNVIYGYADLLGSSAADSEHAALVKDRAMDIAEMSEKARQIVAIFDRTADEREPIALEDLLRENVEAVRREYPDVDVDYEPPPPDVRVDDVLELAVENVVENAAEHNTSSDPAVSIRVETDEDRVRVAVEDNGPGIGTHERSVLERGTETSLEHGSGLGLWLVTWSVDIAGGEVIFAASESGGSVVTLDVPRFPVTSEGEAETAETTASGEARTANADSLPSR